MGFVREGGGVGGIYVLFISFHYILPRSLVSFPGGGGGRKEGRVRREGKGGRREGRGRRVRCL